MLKPKFTRRRKKYPTELVHIRTTSHSMSLRSPKLKMPHKTINFMKLEVINIRKMVLNKLAWF